MCRRAPGKWTGAQRAFGQESVCKKGNTEKEAENTMLKGKIFKML